MLTDVQLVQGLVADYIKAVSGTEPSGDVALDPAAPWRPHLLDLDSRTAWHILTHEPSSSRWIQRMERTLEVVPDISLGVCAPTEILLRESVLEAIDSINAAVLAVDLSPDDSKLDKYASVCDFIYERDVTLGHSLARGVLDRALSRATDETDSNRKGVLLEVLVAVLLSQVGGFRVTNKGISARGQQVDVCVDNGNVSGILSGSPIVLAEAKNWADPVDPKEYIAFREKLATRRGRASLGFLVTTSSFTTGVYTAARRDSKGDILIAMLHGESLPAIWKNFSSITQGLEEAVRSAAFDQDLTRWYQ